MQIGVIGRKFILTWYIAGESFMEIRLLDKAPEKFTIAMRIEFLVTLMHIQYNRAHSSAIAS